MQCEDFAHKLDNFENLTEDEKLEMSYHADVCPDCRKELEFMQSIIDVTRTLPRLSVSDSFLDSLNERIDFEERTATERSVISHLRYNWQKYSGIAACLLLVAVIGANGDMLVSKMNGNHNGVIVESVSTPAPQSEVSDNAPSVENEVSETPQTPSAEVVAKSDNTSLSNNGVSKTVESKNLNKKVEQPKSETPSQASETADTIYETPSVQEATDAPAKTDAPLPTAVVQTEDSSAFKISRQMTNNEDASVPTQTPLAKDPYEIDTGSIKRNRYAIASGMQYPLDENGEPITDYFEKNREEEYSIYADTLIMILSDDYEKAMNIIWKHISGSYSSYYFVEIPAYEAMVSELSSEGISFDANMSALSDTITFRVITY